MAPKKDKKLKIEMTTEPKKSVIDPIEVPGVAFTERAKVKSLMKQPGKQADFKPDYLKEAQFAHQIHLKTEPDAKPSPADLVSKGLMFAGDVAQRLGKSAAKIEEAVAAAEEKPKRKVGRPRKTEGEKKPKKQSAKDKEDEKLAMEVKSNKDAVQAVATELAKHEAESETEGMFPPVSTKKKRAARFAKGSPEAIAHMAKIRAARKKKEDK